jgi:hypothetical protein
MVDVDQDREGLAWQTAPLTRPRLLRPGFALGAASSPPAPSPYQSVPRDGEAIPVLIGVSSIAYLTMRIPPMTALLTRNIGGLQLFPMVSARLLDG